MADLHRIEDTHYAGAELAIAQRAALFLHGRGDASDGMQELAHRVTDDPNLALIFPKAHNHSWYPHSFLAPRSENQPHLDAALALLDELVTDLVDRGIDRENIFLFGFSQGACLALEYASRHATRYGGIMVLSGGLIGPAIDRSRYAGDFAGTDILLGCSDVDFHIPLERVQESALLVAEMGATVDQRIYPGMGHVINEDELRQVSALLQPKNQ